MDNNVLYGKEFQLKTDNGKKVKFDDKDFRVAKECDLGQPSPQCVQVAIKDGVVGVRDSKNPAAQTLMFSAAEWQAFTTGIKKGEFEV